MLGMQRAASLDERVSPVVREASGLPTELARLIAEFFDPVLEGTWRVNIPFSSSGLTALAYDSLSGVVICVHRARNSALEVIEWDFLTATSRSVTIPTGIAPGRRMTVTSLTVDEAIIRDEASRFPTPVGVPALQVLNVDLRSGNVQTEEMRAYVSEQRVFTAADGTSLFFDKSTNETHVRDDSRLLWSDEYVDSFLESVDCAIDDRGDLWVLRVSRNSGARLECCARLKDGSFAAQEGSILLRDVVSFALSSATRLGRANSQLLFADGNMLSSVPFELLRKRPTTRTATTLEAESARTAGVVAASPSPDTSPASSCLVQ